MSVPIIFGSTAKEAAFILNDSMADALIVDSDRWQQILGSSEDLAHLRKVFVVQSDGREMGNALMYEDVPVAHTRTFLPPVREPHDTMCIMYTSGSTGRPKGAILPEGGFTVTGRAAASRLRVSATDNVLCVLPLFHVGGTHMNLAPAIASGSRFTLVSHFSASQFWPIVRASEATHTAVVPTILSILMTAPPLKDDQSHTLRVVATHARFQDFVDRFGVDVCPAWGSTETCGMGASTGPKFGHYANHIVGPAFPEDAKIKIIDEDGLPLPAGEAGEICFKHPYILSGYLGNQEATEKALVDGWFHSGDLGKLDDQGRLYFFGRIKNVIKRSGENISGEEIEATIMWHPSVEECMVFGVPDPIRSEEAYAAVVPREGASLDWADVVAWCDERGLSSWKIPRYISIRTSPLPKLANGKLDRQAVLRSADLDGARDRDAQRSLEPCTDGNGD